MRPQPRASHALMMSLIGKCAISACAWVLAILPRLGHSVIVLILHLADNMYNQQHGQINQTLQKYKLEGFEFLFCFLLSKGFLQTYVHKRTLHTRAKGAVIFHGCNNTQELSLGVSMFQRAKIISQISEILPQK